MVLVVIIILLQALNASKPYGIPICLSANRAVFIYTKNEVEFFCKVSKSSSIVSGNLEYYTVR